MSCADPERLASLLVGRTAPLPRAEAAAELAGEVGAAVTVLRRRGHELRDEAGGLMLACAGRHFDALGFEARRRGRLGTPLEVWERAPSTNDLAHAGAGRGAPEGAVWLAEEQTLGRGRQGRTWRCGAHRGLLVSCLLRPRLEPETRPGLLSLAAALGVCEGLRQATGLPLRTKWPNDLVLDGRKLAGMLVEARRGTPAHAVVGIGVNVHPDAATGPGAALQTASLGRDAVGEREALLAALLAGLERRYEDWRAGRFAALRDAWLELDLVPGSRIEVAIGSERRRGRAVTVTENGLLRFDAEGGGTHDLAAGEVHLT
jgi:BirA family biotin operon repressor/biotin-[acetyl-CoA-carboxylase] ligase